MLNRVHLTLSPSWSGAVTAGVRPLLTTAAHAETETSASADLFVPQPSDSLAQELARPAVSSVHS